MRLASCVRGGAGLAGLVAISGALFARATPGGALPPPQAALVRVEPDSVVDALVGMWHPASDSTSTITLRSYGRGQAYLVGNGWDAIGWFGRARFEGIWRRPGVGVDRDAPRTYGMLRLSIVRPGEIEAYFDNPSEKAAGTEKWTFDARSGPRPATAVRTPSVPTEPMSFDAQVVVPKMPEVVVRVSPAYPNEARVARIEGTVMVCALVGEDGHVFETRVLKSIPALDAAAVTAVRQWVFKPTIDNGRPVPVEVAVPIKFTLP